MNRQQLESLHRLFCRDADGSPSFLHFRRRAMRATFDDSYMIRWCDMWLGIEPDGYTHS